MKNYSNTFIMHGGSDGVAQEICIFWVSNDESKAKLFLCRVIFQSVLNTYYLKNPDIVCMAMVLSNSASDKNFSPNAMLGIPVNKWLINI